MFTQKNPPDRRLAKAFDFTMDDLNANRSGVLSRRQHGFSDVMAYYVMYSLHQVAWFKRLFSSKAPSKKTEQPIQSICGRINLEHHIVDKRLIRSSLFYEYYHLVFPGHSQTFHINRQQFNALTKNLKYRVYYKQFGEQRHVLSIERIIGDCDK